MDINLYQELHSELTNLRQHPFMVFCHLVERDLRRICSNITHFEVGFMLGIIWENFSSEEKELYDPQSHIITPNDIERVISRLQPYLNFRNSIINSSSEPMDPLEDDGSVGHFLIDAWIQLTAEQRQAWRL